MGAVFHVPMLSFKRLVLKTTFPGFKVFSGVFFYKFFKGSLSWPKRFLIETLFLIAGGRSVATGFFYAHYLHGKVVIK